MIEVKNVTKRFGGFAALNDATLSVPTGAVYGLVGPLSLIHISEPTRH